MTFDQAFLSGLLAVTLGLCVWGRWRYDLVAVCALLAAALAGVVPTESTFYGLGHPATVTVALVLIVGRGLQASGAVDLIARNMLPGKTSAPRQIGAISAVGGAVSTVMNNVGALALLLPAVLRSSARAGFSPALVLMPLSFATILGGLATAIGTPPNIIIASARAEAMGDPFSVFDFTPVGGTVAVIGILFVSLIGWRLIPGERHKFEPARELEVLENYVGEAVVHEGSRSVGSNLDHLDEVAAEHDAVILRVLRGNRRIDRAGRREEICAGDVLVVEAGSKTMDGVLKALDVRSPEGANTADGGLIPSGSVLMEAVILPRSRLVGETRESLRFRRRFDISLVAVSRRGHFFRGRLRTFRFQAGDILMFEGSGEQLQTILPALGCLPLSSRSPSPKSLRPAVLSIAMFAFAILAVSVGLTSLPVALTAAVVGMVLMRILPLREIYESVDWPVIVLLAAMIPIGAALEATGTTGMAASALLSLTAGWHPAVALTVVLVVAMTLSDVINNAATAVVMAPVAMEIAETLQVSPDPFLMAVAIGASCAFLTPIGHQNNTLILGPGGYRFGDFWRMGLPLEVLIVCVSVPLLLWFWPLSGAVATG